jgi:hypothetical protein
VNAGTNRRGHFRLKYLPGAGPVLAWDGRTCEVVELSERGLRVADAGHTPPLAERVAGVLHFPDGAHTAITGSVTRVVGGWVVLRLARGVTLGRMLAEQRRVLRDFPTFLRPAAGE